MPRFHDLSGERFGRILVLHRQPDHVTSSGQHVTIYRCQCDCGNFVNIRAQSLTTGATRSCGCLKRETAIESSTKHGGKRDRLYKVWQGVKTRCYNKNCKAYPSYGGRGIVMCSEWKNDYSSFKKWALETGYDSSAPRGECTLDRINNDLGYSPANCRWVNMQAQGLNRRTNHIVIFKGERMPLKSLADRYSIDYGTLFYHAVTKGEPLDDLVQI